MTFHNATRLAVIGASLDLLLILVFRSLDFSNSLVQSAYHVVQFLPRVSYLVFFVTLFRKQIAQANAQQPAKDDAA